MPNWCQNYLELTHSDSTMIQKAAKALEEGTFMETFHPTPDDMLDGEVGNGPMPGWYNWRLKNWGTKWDVQSDSIFSDPNFLSAHFDSAWASPTAFYAFLEELGFEVEAKYFEGGMCFYGRYGEESIDFDSFESIPEDIVETFGIDPWEEEAELIDSEG